MYILFQEAGGSLLRNEHLNYLDRNFPFEIEESDSDYTYAIVSRGSSFYSMVSKDPELLPIDPDTSFSPIFNDVIYQVYRDLYVLPVEERNGEPPHLFDVTENYKDYYIKLKQENIDN